MELVGSVGVGDRVASLRELVGMTRDGLAGAARVSVALVREVEQRRSPASGAFVAAVATALGVDVMTVTGQPYDELVCDPRSAAAGLPALREVLDEDDAPAVLGEPMSLDALRARLDVGAGLRFGARYTELSRMLPELLRHLYAHQAASAGGERAGELLAASLDDAYALARTVTYRFGFPDLTARLDDRRARAAAATGDPLRVAAAAFARTDLPLSWGEYDACTRRLDGALHLIADLPGAPARAVRAQLHLRLALVAARDTRAQDADAHVGEARDIVASGVPAHLYLDINASPVNVDIHHVVVPVELADGTTAVTRAASVHLGDDERERSRIGRYHIDLARAWLLHGDRAKALDALHAARRLTPQLTRYHPSVRETLHVLAEAERRDPDSLTGFAHRAGISIEERHAVRAATPAPPCGGAMKAMPGSVGDRVAVLRRLAGMTQDQLAAAAHVSVSLVRAVEQGRVPASPTFTASVATTLGLDVAALTSQPYADLVSDPRSEAAGIPVLRHVLAEHDSPTPIAEPMPLAELRARLDAGNRLCFRARYAELSRRLPELLRHLYVHWAQPPRGERSRELLAMLLDDAYALAATAIFRFGYLDLAEQVDDRRTLIAAATGDPLRVAGAAYGRTRLPLHRGDHGGCTRRLDGALDLISDLPGETARAVRGQLHLRQAIVAARIPRGHDADAHLAEARAIIASGVPPRPFSWVNCSALNADCQYVAIPVELADGTTAVARAESVHIVADDDQRYRVGHHWVAVARAWVLHGNRTKALESLHKARAVAPQQTRYHHAVRDTVHAIAAADRRTTASLTGFARWAGITL